jgi:hypothetical protein
MVRKKDDHPNCQPVPAGDARALFSISIEPAKTHELNQNLSVRG